MSKSRSSLWNRLRQHRGTLNPLGGNHRGSVFRLLVGEALMRAGLTAPMETWGHGSNAPKHVRLTEIPLEIEVSRYIGAMPFLFLPIMDPPGPDSKRGYIERNAIALLSSWGNDAIDPPSREWLGHSSARGRVRRSGLWNNNHVDEIYSAEFLDRLGELIENTATRR